MKADQNSRHAKRLFYQVAIGSTICYSAWRYLEDEEEDSVEKPVALSKTQPEDGDKANDAQDDDKIDEDDVQVPDVMPEDAFFIPLGRVRQLPHTHYKSSDPEWQSFVEFGSDRKRPVAVRSTLPSSHCWGQDLMLYQRSWQTWSVPTMLAPKVYRE